MADPFVAEIRIWAGNFAPRGWAFCDGTLLQIYQNTALFSLIGTTYGGDGRQTMALPNLKGRAPMGQGNGPGLTRRQIGAQGGTETVTLQETQIASHTHTIAGSDEPGGDNDPANTEYVGKVGLFHPVDTLVNMDLQNSMQKVGNGQAHNNLQPFLAMYFIIAVTGQYPSRG